MANGEPADSEGSYSDVEEQDVLQTCHKMLKGNKAASTATYFGLLVRAVSLS